jgi:hypothetical protein
MGGLRKMTYYKSPPHGGFRGLILRRNLELKRKNNNKNLTR